MAATLACDRSIRAITFSAVVCGILAAFSAWSEPAQQAVNHWRVLASFDAISGDRAMSYKDHPDMALAACSDCGRGGQVLVVTGQDSAVFDVPPGRCTARSCGAPS